MTPPVGSHVARAEIEELQGSFERASAPAVVAWAVERFGAELTVACSFQDAVLVHLAVTADPAVEIVFLDTGFHFPETLDYVEALRVRYDLNLVVLRPGPDAAPWPCGSEHCCRRRKVAPLNRHLEHRAAWMTGLKRSDAPTRADTPVVAWDDAREPVKINPIATWSDDDVARYQAENDLPLHPLSGEGYRSIGCAPTTRPVAPGEDQRAGRWAGTGRVECGLHE